jgi:hypothetical protein
MAELNPQPLPPKEVVQVFVPRSAMFDLRSMQKVTANVLDKLGCGECHSGRILHFVQLDQYVVNPETLEVTEQLGIRGF